MVDPTDSKQAGWYPSSRTPGMDRYWNGDFWTGEYRPSQELQGRFNIESNVESDVPSSSGSWETPPPPVSDVWSTLDSTAPGLPPIPAPQPSYVSSTPGVMPRGGYIYPGNPGAQAYPPSAYPQPNTFGIFALIAAIFLPLLGAILGHVSLAKARRARLAPGVSIAAIAVGWTLTVLQTLIVIPFLIAIFGAAGFSSVGDSYGADEDTIPSWTVTALAEDRLNEQYPGYDWWFVNCSDSLVPEEGSSVYCDVTLYPLPDNQVTEDFTATVKYLGGGIHSPAVTVTLDGEPKPLLEQLR